VCWLKLTLDPLWPAFLVHGHPTVFTSPNRQANPIGNRICGRTVTGNYEAVVGAGHCLLRMAVLGHGGFHRA
jgi:hypothetical protein